MKIRTKLSIPFKTIDSINNQSWLFMALSSTVLALLSIWSIGFFTLGVLI